MSGRLNHAARLLRACSILILWGECKGRSVICCRPAAVQGSARPSQHWQRTSRGSAIRPGHSNTSCRVVQMERTHNASGRCSRGSSPSAEGGTDASAAGVLSASAATCTVRYRWRGSWAACNPRLRNPQAAGAGCKRQGLAGLPRCRVAGAPVQRCIAPEQSLQRYRKRKRAALNQRHGGRHVINAACGPPGRPFEGDGRRAPP